MTLDDLPIEEYEKRIAYPFIAQPEEDMCYTTCIVNTLNDLGRRNATTKLKFSLKRMNEICEYRRGLQCRDAIVPRVINEQLRPFQYVWNQRLGPDVTVELLRDVASNPNNSSPLVNVSGKYLEKVGGRAIGKHYYDHVLIVMGVNHEIIYYYDPYEKYLNKRGNMVKRSISIPAFTELWDGAYNSRWMAWAEPAIQQQALLGDFQNNMNGEG